MAHPLAFALAPAVDVEELVQRADQVTQRLRPRAPAKKLTRTQSKVFYKARLESELLRDALVQKERLESFLVDSGIPQSVLVAFHSWAKLSSVVDQVPEASRAAAPAGVGGAVMDDAFEPLSAAALGDQLGGVVPATVRLREQAHALFSVLPPGRERGRVYPAFQAWPEFVGAPLRDILFALGDPDGGTAWGFFDSTPPELDGLTPVEAVSGRLVVARVLGAPAQALLSAPAQHRLDAVIGAAHAFAADRAA